MPIAPERTCHAPKLVHNLYCWEVSTCPLPGCHSGDMYRPLLDEGLSLMTDRRNGMARMRRRTTCADLHPATPVWLVASQKRKPTVMIENKRVTRNLARRRKSDLTLSATTHLFLNLGFRKTLWLKNTKMSI